MKGLTKLRPLGRIGSKHKNRYGQLGTKSRHGSDSDDSDFAEEMDSDYHSGMYLFNDYRMLREALKFNPHYFIALLGDSDDEMEVSFDSQRDRQGSGKEKDVDTLNAETGMHTIRICKRAFSYKHFHSNKFLILLSFSVIYFYMQQRRSQRDSTS